MFIYIFRLSPIKKTYILLIDSGYNNTNVIVFVLFGVLLVADCNNVGDK